MKVQRVDAYLMFGPHHNAYKVCLSDDVAELEASHAELLEAAKDILDWPESRSEPWFNPIHPRLSMLFDRLRAAIAKAEGEGL